MQYVTLTVEYDFMVDGDGDGNEDVIVNICEKIQSPTMTFILNSYGEVLNVTAQPTKVTRTPYTAGPTREDDYQEIERVYKQKKNDAK